MRRFGWFSNTVPTVSRKPTFRLLGMVVVWQVTSRVANSLSSAWILWLPVMALIKEVLPELVYPTTATTGSLSRLLPDRKTSLWVLIFSMLDLIRFSLLLKASLCLSNHSRPFLCLECLDSFSTSKSLKSRAFKYGISANWTWSLASLVCACSWKICRINEYRSIREE